MSGVSDFADLSLPIKSVMLSSIHRREDGMYVVSPHAFSGKSYLLDEEQYSTFEKACLDELPKMNHAFLGSGWRIPKKLFSVFPFSSCPETKLSLRARLHRSFQGGAAYPYAAWLNSVGLFIFGAQLLLVSLAIVVVVGAPLLDSAPRTEWPLDLQSTLKLVAMWLVYFAIVTIFVSVFLLRRRFRQKYGKPLTLENLYLRQTGRLNGSG